MKDIEKLIDIFGYVFLTGAVVLIAIAVSLVK
nr:MAG TPA: hypothetical protein [Caudoviricetes sp.]DAX64764.1 MAG TPA: hypothetical protein [Caudoviricetes sp.]